MRERKLKARDNYFNKIDTQSKAYWLGYLYADGNINKKEKAVHLGSKDIEVITKFKKTLKSEYTLGKTQIKSGSYYHTTIYSKQLVQDLIKHGVVPNKTFIIQFPKLRKNLIRHFIRGYFDGDGNVYRCKSASGFSICSGSRRFLKQLSKYLGENKVRKYQRGNAYYIWYSRGVSEKYINIYTIKAAFI